MNSIMTKSGEKCTEMCFFSQSNPSSAPNLSIWIVYVSYMDVPNFCEKFVPVHNLNRLGRVKIY